MSCGLGAVILLFFLLDFQEPLPPIKIVDDPIKNSDKPYLEEINQKKEQLTTLNLLESQKIKLLEEEIASAVVQQAITSMRIQQKIDELSSPATAPKKETEATNFSGQLIGMKVEGRNILVLLDTSASMSYQRLVKIIAAMADESGARLGRGEKWGQAKSIVRWLLKNAPSSSQVQVITFSDKVFALTNNWVSPTTALQNFEASILTKVPDGGTSLGRALEYVTERLPQASDLYLITDGLPTLPGDKNRGLTTIRDCFRLPSRKPRYIEGDCREALFQSAVNGFSEKSGSTVNVILLPLEGDPKGSPQYWKWAVATGGRLLSPAEDWP